PGATTLMRPQPAACSADVLSRWLRDRLTGARLFLRKAKKRAGRTPAPPPKGSSTRFSRVDVYPAPPRARDVLRGTFIPGAFKYFGASSTATVIGVSGP